MHVQVCTGLMVEIIYGAVAQLGDGLHVLVPGVGGRIRTVAVQVVTAPVCVVCGDIQPFGQVEHEPVRDDP